MEADLGKNASAENRFVGAQEVISQTRDPMGAAAVAVHRAHMELSSEVSGGRERAISCYQGVVGAADTPGIASLSYDVRLAAVMLRQRLERSQ